MASLLPHAHPSALPLPPADRLHGALIEALYCDMLILADEVRAGPAPDDVAADPVACVRAACASLHLSARLMQMTQILLDYRAGGRALPRLPERGGPLFLPGTLPPALADQWDRAGRLEQRLADLITPTGPRSSPAVSLQQRLSGIFG